MFCLQKNNFFLFAIFYFTIIACNPSRPVFNLEEFPLIPLPQQLENSDEVLRIEAIQSIRIGNSIEALQSMAQNLKSFWNKQTQQNLTLDPLGSEASNAISLEIDESLSSDGAYQLSISSDRIGIKGKTAEGVFSALKTLEQIVMLSNIHGQGNRLPLPGGEILDQPQYPYRGAMLDVARHFFSVETVKRYVDLLSLYKINYLHLHLSDDQGWRIEIKSWPKLTEIGGQTQVGGGEGGFYTQEDFQEIVKYASDRFVTIVPEIDLPGHTNAALASYAELNCNGKATELYTGIKVGFSTLCVDKDVTYTFVDDVIREISEMTPGPYFHIGGDESLVTPEHDFNRFMDRTLAIVKKYNKIPMGWYELITADIPEKTLLQYWAKTEDFSKVIPKKSKILISAASFNYLDMKYDSLTPLGLNWAGYLSVKKAYDWNPGTLVSKIDPEQIVGLEAPLWTETIENFDDISFMAFPRILGHAEIGWTNSRLRQWESYVKRLSFHGRLLEALEVKYYPAEEVDWK
jgi:hexosaminidase